MEEQEEVRGRRGDEIPLDLSALGMAPGSSEEERLVARIMTAAGPELERRGAGIRGIRNGQGALGALAQWTRPILAAAALVGLLSTGVLQWAPGGDGILGDRDAAPLPELLGLPTTVAEWLDEERSPTTRDLVLAMEEGEGW
jgi:hypothetical protein